VARFTADPANAGRVDDRGLWRAPATPTRCTRHPDHFGDACVWWGLFLLSAWHRSGWVLVVAPVLMTWTPPRGTGAPLTEKRMATSRRGHAEHVQRISGFVPMRPRRRPVS
jgi:steroid 5-alpha reductase family enzyme